MTTLVTVVVAGILLAVFGGWRLLAGLYRLDQIDWPVPGFDLFDRIDRSLPRVTRAPPVAAGVRDVVGGLIFIGAAVFAFLSAV